MNDLDLLHNKIWQLIDDLAGDGYSILEIAAVMTTSSLTLYRSSLNETEYNMMIDQISDMRDKAHVIQPPVIN